MAQIAAWAVWPAILALPLTLTQTVVPALHYSNVFPPDMYDMQPRDFWNDKQAGYPSPLGLSLGIGAVVVGQVFCLLYFVYVARPAGMSVEKKGAAPSAKAAETAGAGAADYTAIQKEGARPYELAEGMLTHLGQPEGFVMLGGYLIGTWMSGLMPSSYYSFAGGINWGHVLLQLLLQDGIQYAMHMVEHSVKSTSSIIINKSEILKIHWPFNLYAVSHKPHHRFTNPRLFDAFNGSPADTFLMILVPLIITARLVDANVWSYMAFGSLYANWLVLIHSEYKHPWDGLFRSIGFGTAADHHVHHKLFTYNYGHLFMYYDYVFGTYRDPQSVEHFNKGV